MIRVCRCNIARKKTVHRTRWCAFRLVRADLEIVCEPTVECPFRAYQATFLLLKHTLNQVLSALSKVFRPDPLLLKTDGPTAFQLATARAFVLSQTLQNEGQTPTGINKARGLFCCSRRVTHTGARSISRRRGSSLRTGCSQTAVSTVQPRNKIPFQTG